MCRIRLPSWTASCEHHAKTCWKCVNNTDSGFVTSLNSSNGSNNPKEGKQCFQGAATISSQARSSNEVQRDFLLGLAVHSRKRSYYYLMARASLPQVSCGLNGKCCEWSNVPPRAHLWQWNNWVFLLTVEARRSRSSAGCRPDCWLIVDTALVDTRQPVNYQANCETKTWVSHTRLWESEFKPKLISAIAAESAFVQIWKVFTVKRRRLYKYVFQRNITAPFLLLLFFIAKWLKEGTECTVYQLLFELYDHKGLLWCTFFTYRTSVSFQMLTCWGHKVKTSPYSVQWAA